MKSVILISHSGQLGGAEKCLLEAAIGLKEIGYRVKVIVPRDGNLNVELKINKLETIIQTFPWWMHFDYERFSTRNLFRKIPSQFYYALKVYKIIKDNNPDIVLSNTITSVTGALASYVNRCKHIWFIHEYGKEDHRLVFDLGFKLSCFIIDRLSYKVIVNSEKVFTYYSNEIRKNKITPIHLNVIKPKINESYKNECDIHLVLIGQIKENKGQIDALKVLYFLINEGYDVKLTLIGMTIEEEYLILLKEYIDDNNLNRFVSFIEHVKNPFDYCNNSNTIGLMCSKYEAFGRVTVEFMKLKIPVIIGTESSSIIDIENLNYTYELRNERSLANKIKLIFLNKNEVNQKIKNAFEFANKYYNNENYIGELIQTF